MPNPNSTKDPIAAFIVAMALFGGALAFALVQLLRLPT